jgi:pilus assembly protein CpaE
MDVTLVGPHDKQLEDLLRSTGARVASITPSSLAALAQATAKQPDLIVIDLRGVPSVPAEVASIRRQHAQTGIVIVASGLDPTLLLDAMRAGVNEVVTDPVTQSDLESAISRVVGLRTVAESGQIFGFVGAKGGVGATTVAVNVATALGKVSAPGRTLLIDLHQAGGDAAVFLGAEPRFSVLDALENTHRLDQNFFQGLVTKVGKGIDLLAAPERVVGAPLDPARIRPVVDFVRTVYKYTVLDLPRSDAAVLDGLDAANTIVIVANQELATVKSASRMAAILRQRYGADRVKVIVSRSDRQAEIGQADVERAIGCQIAHTFPSDYRVAMQALNRGRPIALDNHNELSASFKRFAAELSGHIEPAGVPKAGLFDRLTLRRS